jgi:hypothetical protein
MSRKLKKTPTRETPEPKKLDELTLCKLARNEALLYAHKVEAEYLKLKLSTFLEKVDPENVIQTLSDGVRLSVEKLQKSKEERAALLNQIQENLGVDMTKHSYDDQTGVIYQIEDDKPKG